MPLKRLSYDANAMNLQLNDKVAIVTGSSRGIGLAIAHALAAEGGRITLCARTEARLRQAASEVERTAGVAGRVLAVTADVSTEAGAGQLVTRTVEMFGGVDVEVNNVSMAGGGGLLDTSDAQWQEAIDQAVWFVLAQPGVTAIASSGDIRLLARILESVSRLRRLSPAEQEALVAAADPALTVFV